jgi:hypothetical protein
MSMKNSSDTLWNRTCDLPNCSAVPQPAALPAACPEDAAVHGAILLDAIRQVFEFELDINGLGTELKDDLLMWSPVEM